MVNNQKVIAFIPVRGGSKSIPLKNIKLFCGKPLVCWNIEALEAYELVDDIIVATDSDDIWQTVESRHYAKTTLYRRSAENSGDTSSTESVMLEYIKYANLPQNSIFILVQATSPLTETVHFSEALQKYVTGAYDSMLTCVRNYRFFWNEDGNSMNYDYMNRPRRQNFPGMLMENGAFYINTVVNILSNGNRLGGKIGIYEMPGYTATEIDEPDDWMILEKLMRKYRSEFKNPAEKISIKLFVSDIDGTLTDGGMYYSEKGDELKKFNTRDGMGFEMLRKLGIKTAVVTSEDRELNRRRAEKMKIDYIVQGRRDCRKLAAVKEIVDELGITMQEVAYIGDDVNCIDLLSSVGYAACPADACAKVKELPGIVVMTRKGGDGCVREYIDSICSNRQFVI